MFPDAETIGVLITGAGASAALVAVTITLLLFLTAMGWQLRRFMQADRQTQSLLVKLEGERDRAVADKERAEAAMHTALAERQSAEHAAQRSAERMGEMEQEVAELQTRVTLLTTTVEQLREEQRHMLEELRTAHQTIAAQTMVIEQFKTMLQERTTRGVSHDVQGESTRICAAQRV